MTTSDIARFLEVVNHRVAEGPFRASWDSLSGYQVPDWALAAGSQPNAARETGCQSRHVRRRSS